MIINHDISVFLANFTGIITDFAFKVYTFCHFGIDLINLAHDIYAFYQFGPNSTNLSCNIYTKYISIDG